MRGLMLFVMVALFNNLAIARSGWEGKTERGASCLVEFVLENNNISFSYGGEGFGFIVDSELIQKAMALGNNKYVLKGGDGPFEAQLSLYFGAPGVLESVRYSRSAFLIPITRVQCGRLVSQ